MHVSFVDASILSVDNRGIAAKVLTFRASPEALPPSLTNQAPLHAETQAILTLVLLETLRTAPRGNHLRRLKEDSLLDLVVLPLLA